MFRVAVIGLDLSCTGTGIVAMSEDGQMWESTVAGHKLSKDASTRDKTERLIEICRSVLRFAKKSDLPAVRIEGYAFSARGSQNDLAEVHGAVRTQLHLVQATDVGYVTVSSARATVLGKGWGRKSKKEVRKELERRGYDFDDDNVMDAWMIARAYLKIPAVDLGDDDG